MRVNMIHMILLISFTFFTACGGGTNGDGTTTSRIPTIESFSTSISESTTIGTSIGRVVILNNGNALVNSFTLSDTTNFNINPSGEIITLTSFDYNLTLEYVLSVFATNRIGDSNSVSVTIGIVDTLESNTTDTNTTDTNTTTPFTPIDNNLSSICNTNSLVFDNFDKSTVLHLWVEGENSMVDNTQLKWNSITGATSYEFDMTFGSDNISEVNLPAYTSTNLKFNYDSAYLSSLQISSDITLYTASRFNLVDDITITVRALNTSSVTIATSSAITFFLGKNYLSQTTKHITSSSYNTAVGLEWCPLDIIPSSYTIKYSTSESNLDQIISGISSVTLAKTISSLTNDIGYYFSVAGANANGIGKFSQVINTTPTLSPASIDLSIDKVTFNQAVQVDMDDNTSTTPIIANKAGVLRVFVNGDSLAQNLKVEVKLGGTDANGTSLKPIVKEVALSDSSFANADSTNKAIFFDVNASEWMQVGTTFYVELDQNNKITESDDSNNIYPASGEQSFGFEDRYKMRVKLIPVTTNNGAVNITQAIVDGTKVYLEALYPLDEVEVSVGSVFSSAYSPDSAGNGWSEVLSDVDILKDTNVSSDSTLADVFYFGVIESSATDAYGVGGLAYLNSENNFSVQEPVLVGIGRIDEVTSQRFFEIVAHEIGHNHGRQHVNGYGETTDVCSDPGLSDASFPYTTARVGKTGFNSVNHKLLEKIHYHDIMSYCDRYWISDYNYLAIYDFEVKLDTFYARSSNPNAYLAPAFQSRTTGQMIYADASLSATATKYTLKKNIELVGNADISQAESVLYAIVKFKNSNEIKIPFILVGLDHVDIKKLKFFIPSLDEIDSIVIQDTKSLTFTTMQ